LTQGGRTAREGGMTEMDRQPGESKVEEIRGNGLGRVRGAII